MSMLTAQASHLREMSYTVERVKSDAVGKLSLSGSIALAMAAMDMRDAADTIDGLRTRCQDVQRDYDNLRNAMWDRANARAIDFMTEDELRGLCSDLYDHIDELKALIRDMWHDGMCDCDEFGACAKCEYGYLDRARDLGVEVE